MSLSSNEKTRSDSMSLDGEDSGHDSVDDFQSPVDDRERINHLETAVAWIRGEVNNLKDYDRDILQELWKIRSTVHEIQDSQKQAGKEQKYLDDPYLERSPTPNSSHVSPSPSPPPEAFFASNGQRYRTGTLELLSQAPTHLKKPDDDKLLEEFFGSEQLSKLNELKVSITGDEVDSGEKIEEPATEVKLRRVEQAKEGGQPKKLKIPLNPNPIDRNRMSYDVASEMEQLRARIQERARLELEDLDKKFSPKFSHPGFGLTDSHSRQGSLDSSMPTTTTLDPPPVQTRHTRQHSLPVFWDPSSLSNDTKKSPSPQQKTHLEPQPSDERQGPSRSPTPPMNYLHVHQMSAGSETSLGSGTLSPPLTIISPPQQDHMTSQQSHLTSHKPFSTPPLARSPQRNVPQFQSLKERPRPQSGKLPQIREGSNFHAHSYSTGGITTSSLLQSSPLPSQFSTAKSKSGAGYSTAVIKGNKRNSLEGNKTHSNGYPASKPPLPATYNLQVSRGSDAELDQPEVKSIARHSHLRRAPSGEKVAASPRMGRDPTRAPPSLVPGPSNSHHKLEQRISEPGHFQSRNGVQVHPEDIQPYMTSTEVRDQVFKYIPYSDNVAKEKSKSLESSKGAGHNRQNASLLPNEQTWC